MPEIFYKSSGVTATNMEVNQSILSTENNTFASLTLDSTQTCTAANASTNLFYPTSSTLTHKALRYITGTGITAGTRINSFVNEQTMTGATTNANSTVTVASTATLSVGMYVSGTGIAANARINTITNGTQFVMSSNATATNASTVLTFGAKATLSANTTSAITLSNVVHCAYTTCNANWLANYTSVTPIYLPVAPISATPTTTTTGATVTFGKRLTMSANATASVLDSATIALGQTATLSANATANAYVVGTYSGYLTLSNNATSSNTATTTFGGSITVSSAVASNETDSIQLGSKIPVSATPTSTGSFETINLGTVLTSSNNATSSNANATVTFGTYCKVSGTATTTTYAGASTYGGSLTIDQNATATGEAQTIVFGENFTLSNNATATVDGGTYQVSTYGAGDGSTTFNLPADPAGRALGFAGSGSGLTARMVNSQTGVETHILTVNEIPSHSHSIPSTVSITQGLGGTTPATDTTGAGQTSGSAGGGLAHTNMQPTFFAGFAFMYAGAQ
jgi:hypothetical protein